MIDRAVLKEAIDPHLRRMAKQYVSVLSGRGIEGKIVETGGGYAVVVSDPKQVERQFQESWAEVAALEIGGKVT